MKVQKQNGFTLVELSMVVGVMALLLGMVLLGRGYVSAQAVSKASHGLQILKKATVNYAGIRGGLGQSRETKVLEALGARGFVDLDKGDVMKLANRFEVKEVTLNVYDAQLFAKVRVPDKASKNDLRALLQHDPHYYVGHENCAGRIDTLNTAYICFDGFI